MPFKKGNKLSKGRKGKPNVATITGREAFAKHAPAAIKFLASLVNDDKAPQSERVKAAKIITEYAHGRPSQTIEATVEGNLTLELTGTDMAL